MSANMPLPPLLQNNPRLDQWVKFTAPGKVTVSTGRVEIGQGVLTAMRQIAADELDVSLDMHATRVVSSDYLPRDLAIRASCCCWSWTASKCTRRSLLRLASRERASLSRHWR